MCRFQLPEFIKSRKRRQFKFHLQPKRQQTEQNHQLPLQKVRITVPSYPINLNTATVEELVSIDGLGESRASAIIEYRDYLGGYTSVEQIKEISGIGDATYAKLAPYLTV